MIHGLVGYELSHVYTKAILFFSPDLSDVFTVLDKRYNIEKIESFPGRIFKKSPTTKEKNIFKVKPQYKFIPTFSFLICGRKIFIDEFDSKL